MRSAAPVVLTFLLSLLCGLVWSQKEIPQLSQVSARVLANEQCWYPNYRCSITPENLLNTDDAILTSTDENPITATDCYEACKAKEFGISADVTCSYFTLWTTRGVTRCYLLQACYKIYDDWCTAKKSCTSGPANCDNQEQQRQKCPMIAKPDVALRKEPWQCENGGNGALVNGYAKHPKAGHICYQKCNSWQSTRWLGRGSETKGFLKSACAANGTYETPTTNDNLGELVFPKPPTVGGDYPKPSASTSDALSCDCKDIFLIWPPPKSAEAATARTFWYYHPRFESGASMQCEEEVLDRDVTDKFPVTSGNLCRFFCDDYLVAVVSCVNGDWTGEVMEKGLYCYKTPKNRNKLSLVPRADHPTNGY